MTHKYSKVMVDLETLCQSPGGLIATIGACSFDSRGYDKNNTFYVRVEWKKGVEYIQRQGGGALSDFNETVKWWTERPKIVKREIFEDLHRIPIEEALLKFNDFVAGREVWGKGAVFDNATLQTAYMNTGVPCAHSFRDDLCYRTMQRLYPEVQQTISKEGLFPHNAVDDAVYQAEHAYRILWVHEHRRKLVESISQVYDKMGHQVVQSLATELEAHKDVGKVIYHE